MSGMGNTKKAQQLRGDTLKYQECKIDTAMCIIFNGENSLSFL